MDELMHYGVLGMKWGVRKDRRRASTWGSKHDRSIQTRSGDTISIRSRPTSKMASFLAKYFPNIRNNVERTANYDITDSSGKKVGDLQLYRESAESVNVVWIGVAEKYRGRGYANAVMESTISFAKNDLKVSKMTLEVPGDSPDARHIYEKYGFTSINVLSSDDVWGGLTSMELDLKQVKHERSSLIFLDEDKERLAKRIASAIDSKGDELMHYGVLGMKWGVRKDRRSSSSSSSSKKSKKKKGSSDYQESRELKKRGAKNLSNSEIRKVIDRMQLERQYKKITKRELTSGEKFVRNVLVSVGTAAATKVVWAMGEGFIEGFSSVFTESRPAISGVRLTAEPDAIKEKLKRR